MSDSSAAAQLAKHLARVEAELHEEFGEVIEREAVAQVVKESFSHLESAAVRDYVAVIAQRRSRQRLVELVRTIQQAQPNESGAVGEADVPTDRKPDADPPPPGADDTRRAASG